MFNQLVHHVLGHFRGNGKSDPHITAGGGDNGGVNAYQLAMQIDQGATGVTWIDRSIGLDKAFIAFNAQAGPTQRRNNTAGDSLSQSERITDGHHKIAHPQAGGIGNGNLGEILSGLQLEYRQIHLLVGTHQLGGQLTAIGERHLDGVRILHHVGIGQHIAFLGIHNHAGAGTGGTALTLLLLGDIEKTAEERVFHQWITGGTDPCFDGDVDHRRGGFFQHRCQ